MLKTALTKLATAKAALAVIAVSGGGVALAAGSGHLPGTGSSDTHPTARPDISASATGNPNASFNSVGNNNAFAPENSSALRCPWIKPTNSASFSVHNFLSSSFSHQLSVPPATTSLIPMCFAIEKAISTPL